MCENSLAPSVVSQPIHSGMGICGAQRKVAREVGLCPRCSSLCQVTVKGLCFPWKRKWRGLEVSERF